MPEPGRNKWCLLVVDDDAALRELFRVFMAREDFVISEARDGEEGVVQAQTFKPDLIVLDMMLPKLNGLEVLRRLQDLGLGDIPVVVITAFGDSFSEDLLRKEPNVVDYIKKPVLYPDLAARIQKLLDSRAPGGPG